jgi:DNA adenine methylase
MNAPFGWPGGKRYLVKTLLRLIPAHKAYVEVFSGSAKLLFAKEPSPFEILNDIHDDLLTFFRVAKHRPAELAELFERDIFGVGRFKELLAHGRRTARDCELQQAYRFAYLVWWSFGCKSEHFAHVTVNQIKKPGRALRKSVRDIRDVLRKTSERLTEVLIDQRDFADCIRRYDSPDTFFYLDPPYVDAADFSHYRPMEEKRNRELMEILAGIKGRFLLSYDNAPLVRELATKNKFNVKKVGVLYTLPRGSNDKKVTELLISNYTIRGIG